MTTTQQAPVETHRLVPAAVGAAAVALTLTLIGTYVRTPWQHAKTGGWALNPEHEGLGGALFLIGFIALATAVVFGVLVARGLRREPRRTALRSLVLAVVGAVSIPVFWIGLPVIFATGAAVLALDARKRLGHLTVPVVSALVLGAATCVVAVNLAFTG